MPTVTIDPSTMYNPRLLRAAGAGGGGGVLYCEGGGVKTTGAVAIGTGGGGGGGIAGFANICVPPAVANAEAPTPISFATDCKAARKASAVWKRCTVSLAIEIMIMSFSAGGSPGSS